MNLRLNIIIPCYNEKATIESVLNKVILSEPKEKQIIVVDDCSNDGTIELIEKFKDKENVKILKHNNNMGKGGALKTGISAVDDGLILIQDADLEYNPNDYSKLLKPFKDASADVVYGSRFLGGQEYVRIHFFWHYLANKILTFICNIFTNLNMTDMETGYKVFKKKDVSKFDLYENSFGIEPELTIKLSKLKLRFFEVPISYNGRSYEEGKKIGIKDAFRALYCIIKYSFQKL